MNRNQTHPPRWATRLLHWYCKPELVEDLEGDLFEYFDRNAKLLGRRRAKWIYIVDVLKFFRSYTVRKFNLFGFMDGVDLWQNNFKTTLRNISKNSLFAIINVTGLAVSMCVGLIIIALVLELKSFDTFHENHDRIFRVRNDLTEPNSGREEYASTSLKAAKQIKETVAGIEAATIIRRGFEKDVSNDGKIIPLRGLWADESFFRVFTFKVLAGNIFTALKDPNTIVVTEKSALKLFNSIDIVGRSVVIDSMNYSINAVIEDPPLNSHLRFDVLGSFITIDNQKSAAGNMDWMKWDEMWATYLYILLPDQENIQGIQQSLSYISTTENKTITNRSIDLQLQPLNEIVLGNGLSMEIGPSGNKVILWTLGIFAAIIIISACFNYTNLSIARALRRTREVGIRKVVGASRLQVIQQFLVESIVISLISLVLSYMLFLLVRDQFISMDATFQEMVTLRPSLQIYFYFIGLAVVVGLLAGLLPAWFFSKVNAIQVLKNPSSLTLFNRINLRKGLIVFQYSLSLLLVVAVGMEYRQYQYALAYDLGFDTENILTVDMQQNDPLLLEKAFREVSEVSNLSKSNYISSVGASNAFSSMKYKTEDSTDLHFNYVDENYISLHNHKLLAGKNFNSSLTDDSYVVINERAVEWMQLVRPIDAIDEVLLVDGKEMRVVGVVQDFNYDRINHPIKPFAFRYDTREYTMMSLKIQSSNMLTTVDNLNAAWKKVDPIHPLKSEFHDESILNAYNKMSWMAKIIGSIAFLAVFIASLGLLGMVVFTTEIRLKEISIRKVMGASEARLILLMSKGFIVLLVVSASIAIPLAYYLFDQIIFSRLAYRAPIGVVDLFGGVVGVIIIALVMIGYQTTIVARSNPAQVLKTE